MLGVLLSGMIKVVTIPVDIVESVADVAVGGDGSKKSKQTLDLPLSEIRDSICKGLEDL